ncbi:MAG TPA: SGNH/GDSL hydrolase family protein [Roseiarcus sp.]|nr:SGNH/GDSL hydrolase family protein [Roseiarcus sp.]
MKLRLGMAALAASLACGAAHATTPLYSTIYSFGDSLSDAGNVFAASGGTIPMPPYVAGRFSNGPNWLDDLSEKVLGAPASPSLAGGNDFAWGGAQTGTTNASGTLLVPSLDEQVSLFGLADPLPKSGALYTLDIGGNDIGNALSAVAKNPLFDLSAFLSEAVGNTVGAIDTLYGDGARALLYYEVPDLSLVPAFMAGGALGGELAMQFNEDVLAGIKPLETGPDPLTVFDAPVFSATQTIVGFPARFGFTNVTSPCLSGNFESPGTECADPGQYLFWDGEHPTAAGHALTADLAYDVLTGAPDPIAAPEASTWAMMLIGFGGLGLAGWRARARRRAS